MKPRGNIRQTFFAWIFFGCIASPIGADFGEVSLRLHIIDSTTQVPISGALISLRKPDAQLEKLGASANGIFNFSHAATTQLVQLRVEAQYYTTRAVSLSLTNSHIEQSINLDRTNQFRGFVIAPTGQPASGAQIALLTKSIRMAVLGSDGRIESFNQIRTDITDTDGQFFIGPEPEAESFFIVHDLGVGQVPVIGWTNETKVHLRPWVPAKGRMLINNVPAVNEVIMASGVKFPQALWPVHLRKFETQTDPAGFFSFDRLPPGEVTLQRKVAVGVQAWSYSHGMNFMVDAALPNDLKYYLHGRSIRGEALPPDGFDWNAQFMFAHIAPPPQPPTEFSPMGVSPWPTHFGATLSEKGKFEATAVPPGKYILRIQAHRRDDSMETIEGPLIVPDGPGPIDLGQIKLMKTSR